MFGTRVCIERNKITERTFQYDPVGVIAKI